MEPKYISVIGGGRCGPVECTLAEEVGRLVALEGATLVCGGLGGVMEAAARGAKEAGGTTIGILPGHDRAAANPYLDHAFTTGIGHARNLAVVSSGDAVIAVGGGYGTLSEIGLAAAIGRPVAILGGWRLQNDEWGDGVSYAASPPEAMALVRKALTRGASAHEAPARQAPTLGADGAPDGAKPGDNLEHEPRRTPAP